VIVMGQVPGRAYRDPALRSRRAPECRREDSGTLTPAVADTKVRHGTPSAA
jgi:hypothetical protein